MDPKASERLLKTAVGASQWIKGKLKILTTILFSVFWAQSSRFFKKMNSSLKTKNSDVSSTNLLNDTNQGTSEESRTSLYCEVGVKSSKKPINNPIQKNPNSDRKLPIQVFEETKMEPSKVKTSLSDKIKALENDLKHLQSQMDIKNKELKACMEINKDYASQLKYKETEVEYYRITAKNSLIQLKDKDKELQAKSEEHASILKSKQAEVEKNADVIQQYINYKEEKQQQLIFSLKNQIASYKKAAECNAQSCKEKIEYNASQLETKDSAIKCLQKIIEESYGKLNAKDDEVKKSQELATTLKSKNKHLEDCLLERTEYVIKLEYINEELVNKNEQVNTYQKTVTDMAVQLSIKDNELQSYVKLAKAHAEESTAKDIKIKEWARKVKINELESYKVIAEDYASEIDLKLKEIKSLKEINEGLRSNIDLKNQELISFKQQMDEQLSSIKENMDLYDDTYKKLRQLLNSKEQALTELQTHNDLLQKSNTTLQKELDMAKDKTYKYFTEISAIRNELKMLMTRLQISYLFKGASDTKLLNKTREAIIQSLRSDQFIERDLSGQSNTKDTSMNH